jgi:hypothetical protein
MTTSNATFTFTPNNVFALFRDNADTAPQFVLDAYASADKGTKATIRTNVTKGLKAAIAAGDLFVAQRIMSVESDLVTKSEKAPVDLNVVVGTMVSNHLEAAIRLLSGNFTTTVETDNLPVWDESLIEDLRHVVGELDLPDFDPKTVESATTVRTGSKTKENDIRAMIRETVDSVEVGTVLTIAELRRAMAATYPDKGITAEWDGRLNAALFTRKDGKTVESDNTAETMHVRSFPTNNKMHAKGTACIKVTGPVNSDNEN